MPSRTDRPSPCNLVKIHLVEILLLPIAPDPPRDCPGLHYRWPYCHTRHTPVSLFPALTHQLTRWRCSNPSRCSIIFSAATSAIIHTSTRWHPFAPVNTATTPCTSIVFSEPITDTLIVGYCLRRKKYLRLYVIQCVQPHEWCTFPYLVRTAVHAVPPHRLRGETP